MSQSLASIYVHVVFSTAGREPWIADAWRDDLFHVIGANVNHLGCQSITVGGVADHVHLLFELGRNIAIADAVRRIKSTSTTWVNRTHKPAPGFRWQGGYAAFSVSQSGLERVKTYIRRQPERHAKQVFQDELRAWLQCFRIDWDERYVWD